MIWCLHGAVGMAADWDGFAERMAAAGFGVRAVDLWRYLDGPGMSLGEFGVRFGLEAAAADAEPVVLGYSMGGRLALHALLAEPGIWSAAVIVSAHPGLRGERERVLRMADDAHWAARALHDDWGDFVTNWDAQEVLGGVMAGCGPRAGLETRRRAVARSFTDWSLGKQDDLRGGLGGVGAPVLWVNGQRDRKFRELGAEAVECLEHGRQVVVAGSGHRVPWEAPEEFAAAVGDFLRAGE